MIFFKEIAILRHFEWFWKKVKKVMENGIIIGVYFLTFFSGRQSLQKLLFSFAPSNFKDKTMDPETVWGLPSSGKEERLLIGRAHWYCISIGPILAAAVKGTSMT